MTFLDVFGALLVAVGASWCAGLNLYATVFVLGAMHRWVDGFSLPGSLDVLASHWVMWPALALYIIEFLADKFPAVDSAWDTVHTFIRPPAGAVLAAMAVGDVPLPLQVCAALVGGFLAFGSHATKATARVVAHTTGTSPIVSPVASVTEDVLVVSTLGLIVAHPIIAAILLVLMMVGAFILMRLCWKFARFLFSRIFGRSRGTPPIPSPGASPTAPAAGSA